MALSEIVLATTEPETEWVRGRALRKVNPTYRHGLLQRRIATALGAWAEANDVGRVATEWRFRLTPPGDVTRPLVPDVAFLSYATLAKSACDEEVDVPLMAPTVAVEVLSPDDREDDVDDKIATYLAAGTLAVIAIDPARESVAIHDANGERIIEHGTSLQHHAIPGFALGIAELFVGKS